MVKNYKKIAPIIWKSWDKGLLIEGLNKLTPKPLKDAYKAQDYLRHYANDEILKLAMIETEEALGKLDEIMSTPGLDGIYIGPADLSLALGEEPGFDKAENTKAYKTIMKILDHAKKN